MSTGEPHLNHTQKDSMKDTKKVHKQQHENVAKENLYKPCGQNLFIAYLSSSM